MFRSRVAGPMLVAVLLLISIAGWATPAQPLASACQGRVRSRQATSGPQVTSVTPNLICFGGDIDKQSAIELIGAITKVPQGHTLTLVVDGSDGGDVASGIHVAEVLSARKSTVVANGVCASSCANYLWLTANHRVITAKGLLIFHGGATLAFVPAMDKQIDELAKAHPNANIGRIKKEQLANLKELVKRQRALLINAGVDKNFFSLFDQVTVGVMPASAPKDCKTHPNAKFVVFSPGYLESKGVVIEHNDGPSTALAVHAYLDKINKKISRETCFWN